MNDSLNILLVEDDADFAFVVKRMLRSLGASHAVEHVTRMSDALQHLSEQSFDIVLTDLTLPDAIRLESVKILRQSNPEIPLIVLTLLESAELASEALQSGAQDFIVKDAVSPLILERSIQNGIERQKMVGENSRLIATLKSQQLQLNRKNDRLKQLIDTAHRFADNVSHEFRTPLTVIREYAALVREGLLGDVNEQQSEFMDVIVYRVDDLNRMVDDMLDSSKLDAGIMGMHREPTNAADILKTALAGLQLKARVRGVELTCQVDEDLPMVFCDNEKAGRVITNLAANAIKFTDNGEGRVHLSICHKHTAGEVEISVTDNGPGINPEDLKRMYERFQQLGTSTQSSTKGFGLGLNIARELVELNYGSMTVESELDAGTTFRFTVPVDNWPEIVKRYSARLKMNTHYAGIVVMRVTTVGEFTDAGIRDMDSFWRFTERQTDLIRKTDTNEWTLLVACSRDEIDLAVDRFLSEHAEVSRNRPHPLPQLNFEELGCFNANDPEAILAVACEPAVTC